MSVVDTQQPRGGAIKFAYASGSRPLAGYEIKRGVGRGGFGEVYYATSDAGKEVALKLIRRNLDVELRGVQQCLNLKHPHLVGLYDIRYDDHEDAWVVMEYVRGESLEDVVRRHPTGMPEELAVWWFLGVASGVAYLHDQGIVHRDLKPANLFNDEGVVKIGDYGLSKFISASRRSGQTESVGTVHYMAPEIANGRYGKEIDIYALGVMFYEMLTGHVPFEGESVGEVLMKHLTAQPDLTRLPARFRAAIGRALVKDPQQRFSNAGELLAAIGLTSAAGTTRQTPPLAPPGAAGTPSVGTPPPGGKFKTKLDSLRKLDFGAMTTNVGSPGSHSDEPIMAAVRRNIVKVRDAWREIDIPKPIRVVLLILAAVVALFTAPYWIAFTVIFGVLYLVYFVIRAIVMPRAHSDVPPNHASGAPEPSPVHETPRQTPTPQPLVGEGAAVTPCRRSDRLRRRRRFASALPPKSSRQKLTELLGSLLLSAAVSSALAVVLTLAATGKILIGEACWLAGVGTLGAWGVLIPAKFWEGTGGEPILRRFVLLCVGLSLGFLALGLDEALVVDLLPVRELDPRLARAAHVAKEALFLAYFTFLLPVLRWWRLADPLRGSRFSLWYAVVSVGWAGLLSMAWPFPQPWGMMVAGTMAVSIQLAATWSPHVDPYAVPSSAEI